MRKAISLSVLILVLFIIYQFGVTFFKKEHMVEYSFLTEENRSFQIQEKFKNDQYFLGLESGAYHFSIAVPNQFHKNKQIIEDILSVEKDGMLCIYPIYQGGVEDSLWCSRGDVTYSYEVAQKDAAAVELVQQIQNKGMTYPKEKPNYETMNVSNKITYYYKDDEESLAIWDYRGYYVVHDKMKYREDLYTFDRYENTLSQLIGPYYITPNYNNNKLFETDSFRVVNITTSAKYDLPVGYTLSNYTYINGVVDDKLYLFDPNQMLQLELDPASKKVRVVGNKELNAQYYDGKWQTRNIYDFVNNKILFQESLPEEIANRYSYREYAEDEDAVYFVDQSQIYLVYKEHPEVKILLLSMQEVKEWQVIKGRIYFIQGDTLYRYTTQDGLETVLVSSEFRYNWNNVYAIYVR